MFRHWLRTARNIMRLSDASGEARIQHIDCALDVDQFGHPILGDSIRAEQHRIQMVHIQNRQMQMNIDLWRRCSVSAIYERQELVSDQRRVHVETKK